MKEFIISEKEEGITLLKYSLKMLPGAGQGMIRKFLRKKNIELNSKRSDGSSRLMAGDKVSFFLSDETFEKFHAGIKMAEKKAEFDSSRIIYKDDDYLIYDKPAGLLSQSDSSGELSLNDMLLSGFEAEGVFRPSICNRLDRNTSGIVLCGLSIRGLQSLDEGIKNRRIDKYYMCICEGGFEKEGIFKARLKKDRDLNKSFIIDSQADEGDIVETAFRVVKRSSDLTLLEARLLTGKPHQIRASLAYLGHPIAGDRKYGAEQNVAKRQLLHAYRVVFPQDILEGKSFEAPLPDDMKGLII